MKSIGLFKNCDGRRVLCWPIVLLFLFLFLTLPALSGLAFSWLMFGDLTYERAESVVAWSVFCGGMWFGMLIWAWRRLPIEKLPGG